MKYLLRTNVILAVCGLLIACGQTIESTPTIPTLPIIIETLATPTVIPTSSTTAIATPTAVTPIPTHVPPTLIPTIDPMLLPELLNKALSVETADLNGHKARQITGWDLGFRGWSWLDSSHMILYPISGQDSWGEVGQPIDVTDQLVVINVDTGHFWSLHSYQSHSPFDSAKVDWSSKLTILIAWETIGETSTVSTYTYDGQRLATYPGKLSSISPSGTKILMADGTVLDLQSKNQIKLNWNMENYDSPVPSGIYWTPDETRLYQCCYFYADLANGKSFHFTETDFLDRQGNPFNYDGLWMYRGEWVRDDKYFLVWWSYIDDGDMRYLPMFNPAEKIIYDVRAMASISPDLTCYETNVSPDGQYLWIRCYAISYLINLSNFESTSYPGYEQGDIGWSNDSQFAWLTNYNYDTNENNFEILSVVNKELKPFPVAPSSEWAIFWHPTDHVLVYSAKDKHALIFLDAAKIRYRELSFQNQDAQAEVSIQDWSPNEEKLIFITDKHTLWQVDYPSLENMQQIMTSSNTIRGAQWSPDGQSISFINGSDIYIVEMVK